MSGQPCTPLLSYSPILFRNCCYCYTLWKLLLQFPVICKTPKGKSFAQIEKSMKQIAKLVNNKDFIFAPENDNLFIFFIN